MLEQHISGSGGLILETENVPFFRREYDMTLDLLMGNQSPPSIGLSGDIMFTNMSPDGCRFDE